MSPIGMLAPLSDVFLVMPAEVVTILGTEMVLFPALIVVIAIVPARSLSLRSATVVSGSILRHRCACENRQSGSQQDSM